MNILIVYASQEGQTATIAQFIADAIRRHGHQATVLSGDHLPKDFSTADFDAAIIGGSIHMSAFPGYLETFITTHRDWLNQVPSAMFTVCMAIHSKNAKEQATARSFGPELADKTRWQPKMMETFAGAIKYRQYGFITRLIMRYIAKKEGDDTDTSRDHEYTDWDAVTRFSEQFLIEAGAGVNI